MNTSHSGLQMTSITRRCEKKELIVVRAYGAFTSRARTFRKFYIGYMQAEASNTTAREDIDQVCRDIEVMALQVPLKELLDMAINDRIIDNYAEAFINEDEV